MEMNSKADILVEFLRKRADGKTEITLLNEFNHTALDIISSVWNFECFFCPVFKFSFFLKGSI